MATIGMPLGHRGTRGASSILLPAGATRFARRPWTSKRIPLTSIATEAAGAQGQQLRGSVAANFGEAATDWRKVRDEMDRRQADFSAKVQEKAKALQTSLGPLTNKITVGAQKISEIKRQLEAATSTDSIKKLRQDLVSKAQDLSLLADVAYSAILGKMTDEVTRLARPSDDLANFQAIDSARGGILDAAQEYRDGNADLSR
jgi:hypothetical protein